MSAVSNLFAMTDQVALITGSTKGIGRAVAEQFVEHGARVVISSRNQAECDSVASLINNAAGTEVAFPKACDITDLASLEALVEAVGQRWGRIDTLVCNATYSIPGSEAETPVDEFSKILTANIVNNFRLCEQARPFLTQSQSGSVILMSTIGSVVPSPSTAAYGIAKRGLLQLCINLAVEWAADNIRVNAIIPGFTRTAGTEFLWSDDSAREAIEAMIPLRRFAEPSEIASIAVLLASPAGAYLTGQAIVADGGFTLRGSAQSSNIITSRNIALG